jgi:hypothetical protein
MRSRGPGPPGRQRRLIGRCTGAAGRVRRWLALRGWPPSNRCAPDMLMPRWKPSPRLHRPGAPKRKSTDFGQTARASGCDHSRHSCSAPWRGNDGRCGGVHSAPGSSRAEFKMNREFRALLDRAQKHPTGSASRAAGRFIMARYPLRFKLRFKRNQISRAGNRCVIRGAQIPCSVASCCATPTPRRGARNPAPSSR